MNKHTFLIYALLWLLIVVFAFYQQIHTVQSNAVELAVRESVTAVELYQTLKTGQSVLYAPVTEQNQPNLSITVPERDIQTSDGKRLTLISPFCINRQKTEASGKPASLQLHLTAIQALQAANRPDSWEMQALNSFTQANASHSELITSNGATIYRYIRALQTDSSCVSCHPAATGSFYGGISTQTQLDHQDLFTDSYLQKSGLTHLLIALVGWLALLTAYIAQSKLARRLDKAKRHLQLAYMDVLTQLPNRRYYDFFVNREWKRAKRQNYPVSIIMIDIDYFKSYNDNFGHQQGDKCLQQVARTLRHYFRRAGDLIARYGGEEFCVVVACDKVQIAQLAEILRKAVEDLKIPHPGSQVSDSVTISLGTATAVPSEAIQFDELLRLADQTLYKAKALGRNRVENYQDPTQGLTDGSKVDSLH